MTQGSGHPEEGFTKFVARRQGKAFGEDTQAGLQGEQVLTRKRSKSDVLSEVSTESEKGDAPPTDHLINFSPFSLLFSLDSSQAQVSQVRCP